MALNKVKLRLKETEEEAALKQKYERLRKKRARTPRRRAPCRSIALACARSFACSRGPDLLPCRAAQDEKEKARLAKEGGEAAGGAGDAVRPAAPRSLP